MCFKCQGTLWCLGVSGLVIRIYSETIHFYNYYHSPIVFSKKVSFYCFFCCHIYFWVRLHGDAIFGVVSVSDTETGTTRRIPVSGECPLFFLFFFFVSLTRADAAPTRPTRQQWRKKKKENHRFWVWEIILRNPPLKFSTHPLSDLCRYPLCLAGARSRRSASSIDVEWRRALSLPAISLSRCGQQVRPPLSFFFFFFFPFLRY